LTIAALTRTFDPDANMLWLAKEPRVRAATFGVSLKGMSIFRSVVFRAMLVCAPLTAVADEGMWTFDNPPAKQLQEKYGFTPTKEWLDHVRLSSVRLNDGGSGSFVSPHGLLLTNHHVARGQLQKNSSPEHDYIRDGFYAAAEDQEMKSPDLEVNVLVSMEDVTARVQAAVKKANGAEREFAARKAEIAAIESESLKATGLRSDVITLYRGGEYWLYRYKKYTDVRIVFAPEQQTAFFGGDPDNFTYPRYDLIWRSSACMKTASRSTARTTCIGTGKARRRTSWCSPVAIRDRRPGWTPWRSSKGSATQSYRCISRW